MAWMPGNRCARRIANALLRAYRDGLMPDEWPSWGESTCVFAITHSRLTPGTRLQLARLWRQYGDATWVESEKPEIRTEMVQHLSLSA